MYHNGLKMPFVKLYVASLNRIFFLCVVSLCDPQCWFCHSFAVYFKGVTLAHSVEALSCLGLSMPLGWFPVGFSWLMHTCMTDSASNQSQSSHSHSTAVCMLYVFMEGSHNELLWQTVMIPPWLGELRWEQAALCVTLCLCNLLWSEIEVIVVNIQEMVSLTFFKRYD